MPVLDMKPCPSGLSLNCPQYSTLVLYLDPLQLTELGLKDQIGPCMVLRFRVPVTHPRIARAVCPAIHGGLVVSGCGRPLGMPSAMPIHSRSLHHALLSAGNGAVSRSVPGNDAVWSCSRCPSVLGIAGNCWQCCGQEEEGTLRGRDHWDPGAGQQVAGGHLSTAFRWSLEPQGRFLQHCLADGLCLHRVLDLDIFLLIRVCIKR